MTHYMKLNPSPFSMIVGGYKTIELRLLDEKRQRIAIGDTLIFTNTESGEQISCSVKNLYIFASFEELYSSLPLDKCGYLPEQISGASAEDMELYYTIEEQRKYGVVGIEIELYRTMRDTKKLLITGFDPFGGQIVNPAWESVSRLPDVIGDWKLTRQEIPTVFGLAAQTVLQAAEQTRPDAILCIGQAGGRAAVTPEVYGVNLRHARIADNAGNTPRCTPIVTSAPGSYPASVPVRDMVSAVRAIGLPCEQSYSAGRFVCNDLLYSLLHHYHGTQVKVGFIHVPYLPEQATGGEPSLPLCDCVRALSTAIEAM